MSCAGFTIKELAASVGRIRSEGPEWEQIVSKWANAKGGKAGSD